MDYTIIDQYLVYKELRMDAFGKNFRARRMVNDKPTDRKIVVDIHPFISEDIISMGQLKKHFDEIKKSDIENLLVPENMFQHREKTFWVFPDIKGKSLKEIIEDSEKKREPITFELAISIALKCSILLDIGSMIILDGKSSSHGFLTPDNILINTSGEIYLKYYGLLSGIEKNNRIHSEFKSKYHEWVTPEFYANEEVLQQSDFYCLGNVIYRILTGRYFSVPPGMDFETAITSISFTHDIPSTDTDFLTNIIEFFRKTLNPDVSKRFSNINEFVNFISKYFCISDSLSITSKIESYMNTLYSEDFEEEKTVPISEIPQIKVPPSGPTPPPEIIDEIPRKLKQRKRSPLGVAILGSAVIVVLGTAFYHFVIKPSSQNHNETIVRKAEATPIQIQTDKVTEPENNGNADTEDLNPTPEEDTDPIESAPPPKNSENPEKKTTPPSAKKQKPRSKTETIPQRGVPQLPLEEVHSKPVKVSGADPVFASDVREKYGKLPETIYINALIDEGGNIEKMNILNHVPNELQLIIKGTLYKWKFTPAGKNDQIVKVWLPISIPLKCEKKVQTQKPEKPLPQRIPEIQMADADIKPVKVSCPPPQFSETLKRNYIGRRAKVQGTILIDENGKTSNVSITSHIPDDLKAYIQQKLLSWTFMPGKKNGRNVRVWYPISFKIHIK